MADDQAAPQEEASEEELRSATGAYIEAIDRLAQFDVEPGAAFLLFLMLWERFGPEIQSHVGEDECPIAAAEELIVASEQQTEELSGLCAYRATGALMPDEDELVH